MISNRRYPSEDPARDFLLSLIYARVPSCCMTPAWLAVAYRDPARDSLVMVLPPFHYVVQFAYWILWQWDRYRHRPSWIDRHVKEAITRSRQYR